MTDAGIAVVAVMVITTCMMTLIMMVIWKTSIWWIALFFITFGAIEGTYLSSVLYKFKQGGYLPLAFAFVLMVTMGIWRYVHLQRYMYELRNKVSNEFATELATNPSVNRMLGIGLLCSELVQGIPPIFPHFVANILSLHSVLIFVSIKPIPISKVAAEERFLFRQVGAREHRMFRCIVRYGYNDKIQEPHEFECHLVEQFKEFIRQEHFIREIAGNGGGGDVDESASELESQQQHSTQLVKDGKARGSTVHVEEILLEQPNPSPNVSSISSSVSINSSNTFLIEEETQFVEKAMEKGVVYLLGEAEVVAEPESTVLKKMVVNHAYNFLRRISTVAKEFWPSQEINFSGSG